MSPRGRSEQVTFLRAAIARIEETGGGAIARDLVSERTFAEAGTVLASAVGATPLPSAAVRPVETGEAARGRRPPPALSPGARVPLGQGLTLDRLLRGGLRRGALHEIVAARPGDAGPACGFALALAARCAAAAGAPVVWILEEAARRESGVPYGPGLAAHGLDPGRLILVRTKTGDETLWATEEALKCRGLGAVVIDLWGTRRYDLVASRRLVLAAQRGATPGFLVAAGASGRAAQISSAAGVRFEVAAAASPASASADHRLPLPGPAAWTIRLARVRAGPGGLGGFDTEKFWPLVWDHAEARFCDALPLPVPALPRDRSPAAVSRDAA